MADDIGGYRAALMDLLKDRAGSSWTEEELDAALSLALADVSQRLPLSLSGDVTLDLGGREVPLASLAGLLWVEEVWWPYEGGSYPPNVVPFEVRDGVAHLYTVVEPAPGDMVHVLYAGEHTISGLEGASETTVPREWLSLLVTGAAGYAALAKAASMAREYSWPSGAARMMSDWGQSMLALFRARLKALRPASAPAWVSWG
ncbi:MAG: hypothetical protein HPY83_09895 [Anaerolineae bacterium]|nr:hypothetical protein [Anaerolineae bacterium]